ncbi:hypothetical protein, partial [Burkholderia multivorans]|uniref:hypothetical protein n=3 Tax=Burkholderia multivorans TaxID=87883 RepID=UPI001C65C61C
AEQHDARGRRRKRRTEPLTDLHVISRFWWRTKTAPMLTRGPGRFARFAAVARGARPGRERFRAARVGSPRAARVRYSYALFRIR